MRSIPAKSGIMKNKENFKMQQSRIKTVMRYVLPTVLSQCAFFLFTIIDGIFVGHGVGTDALGAVNLAMPFIMVIGAAFMLTTIGGVTITAIRMGRKDFDGANNAFMHSLLCTLVFAIFFTVVGTFFRRQLAVLLGANGAYVDMVCEYLLWYSVFTIPAAFSAALQGFGRNDGAPVFVMISTIVSTLLNIFLDWLFVFPLHGGIGGAAIATGISQTASFLIMLSHFVRKRGTLRIKRFKFDGGLVGKVLKRGFPEMLSQLTTPITIFCMNLVIAKYIGNDGINAYSIVGYIISFAFAVFIGVSEGMQPLFGQSYGDKNADDLRYYRRAGFAWGFGGSVIVYILIVILGELICRMFGADKGATELAIVAIPKYGWSFLFGSLNTIISAYLYSTKRTKEAALVNTLRGFVVTPLCVIVLSGISKGSVIWFTVGIAETVTFAVSMAIMKYSERNGVQFDKK